MEVGPRDPFVRAHPDRIVRVDGRLNIRRTKGICSCLEPADGAWPCVIYETRPRTCRDFEKGSDNCLTARRRMELTP